MAYPAPSLSSFDCALLTQILCRSSTARRWIGTKWWSRGCRADQSSDFYPATPDLCRVHFSRWIQDFGYLSGPIRYPKITQEDPRRWRTPPRTQSSKRAKMVLTGHSWWRTESHGDHERGLECHFIQWGLLTPFFTRFEDKTCSMWALFVVNLGVSGLEISLFHIVTFVHVCYCLLVFLLAPLPGMMTVDFQMELKSNQQPKASKWQLRCLSHSKLRFHEIETVLELVSLVSCFGLCWYFWYEARRWVCI